MRCAARRVPPALPHLPTRPTHLPHPFFAGLDIDALRDVSHAVNGLKSQRPDMGILMVTHYKVRLRCVGDGIGGGGMVSNQCVLMCV